MWLRQSTASQEISLGQFLDSTDGNTEENSLTISNTDIKLRKGGTTTLANKNSGGATSISNGVYHATLDATDTNTLGLLEVYVHVAGALATKSSYMILPAASYDALVTNGLNNFDAASDAVANVTLVATTTTNTDMRGTDSANTVVPPSVAQFDARTLLAADYFDPAVDAVANVTLVATTTTNTDMRGTDSANTVAPDNASIASILVDTNDLQTNQGNWLTATGFSTSSEIAALNNISVADIFAGGDVDAYSLEESLKLILAANVGVLSGAATTTITIQAADASKARLTATVDSNGNRSAVIKDATG